MTTASVDAAEIRAQQKVIWDGVSAAWERWQPAFERGASIVTERLLDIAGVAPGDSVLDIGSGTGQPALSAARVVGPDGTVLGIDLSPLMVEAARRASVGLGNVHFVVGSAEMQLLQAYSFDAVLSRWALMFAADRVELLRKAAQLLRPGGLLAAAVWSEPQNVPMISLAFQIISSELALPPPPPGPGPFAMSNADEIMADFEGAGFSGVEVSELVVPFRLASVDEFGRFSFDVLPPRMKQLLQDRYGSLFDHDLWGGFVAAAGQYREANGTVYLPSTCLCVRAVA
ncbi:class I SAM-dependent methyltransferase [Mycobacterium sp.]|uniref:class I SAM-dependent methyltransferase n=1 Tax=Mycobacterium sp. TaxID=1785 RepID=UPI002C4BC705|nr:class I SAM-dependent methyltransferase [Mycobacterium sp.]HTY35363.1 class I SAM-dependent methyltransferase [Mycobacterium sp.]